jgi:hypothetical protein
MKWNSSISSPGSSSREANARKVEILGIPMRFCGELRQARSLKEWEKAHQQVESFLELETT